jgi:hypothetical protein
MVPGSHGVQPGLSLKLIAARPPSVGDADARGWGEQPGSQSDPERVFLVPEMPEDADIEVLVIRLL